jgi:hypothetical protein
MFVIIGENKVLRGILRGKGDEITGERRKIHNQELTDPHTSPIILE